MSFKIPFIRQDDVSKYNKMEVEAENSLIKDKLLHQQQEMINVLTQENLLLQRLVDTFLAPKMPEELPEKFEEIKQKPHFRTMTQVRLALEERSRRKIGEGKGVKDAEDINPSDVTIGMP